MIFNDETYEQVSNLVQNVLKYKDRYSDEDIIKIKDIIRGLQLDGKLSQEDEYFFLGQLPSVSDDIEEDYDPEQNAAAIESGLNDIINNEPMGNKYYNEGDDKTIEKKQKASFSNLFEEPLTENQFYNQDDKNRTSFADTIKKKKEVGQLSDIFNNDSENTPREKDDLDLDIEKKVVKKQSGFNNFIDDNDDIIDDDDEKITFEDTVKKAAAKSSGFGACCDFDDESSFSSDNEDDWDDKKTTFADTIKKTKPTNSGFDNLF